MSNEVTIQKNTGLLLVGLFLAIVIGGYVVFGAGSDGTQSNAQANAPQVPSANSQPYTTTGSTGDTTGSVQEVYIKASSSGYDPGQVTVKKGIPVRLHFTANNAGCGSYLMIYGLNQKVISKNGQEAVIEFTPQQEGTYEYNCGMRMLRGGQFVVTA